MNPNLGPSYTEQQLSDRLSGVRNTAYIISGLECEQRTGESLGSTAIRRINEALKPDVAQPKIEVDVTSSIAAHAETAEAENEAWLRGYKF